MRMIMARGFVLFGCILLFVLMLNPLGSISSSPDIFQTVGWYTLVGAGLALIVMGMRRLLAERSESQQADQIVTSQSLKSRTRVKKRGNPIVAILTVLCLLYGMYAAVHYVQGKLTGCNDRSILMTLYPVRQIYFIPTIEREWSAFLEESMADSTDPFAMMGAAISEALREPIMEVVRYGDCQLIHERITSIDNAEAASQNSAFWQQDPQAWSTREDDIQNTWSAGTNSDSAPTTDRLAVANIANTDLRIRRGPGLEHAIVGKLSQGEQTIAIGRNDGGSWLLLEKGWVSADYVDAIDNAILKLPVRS